MICFPHLCDPLANQNISYALQKFPSLRSLKLADSNNSCCDLSVDVLAGVDYYHNFFTGKVFRTRGGPTANETYFGWVLSGKISSDPPHSSSFSNLVYFLRFLWYEDPFDCSFPLVSYRFLRLVFGLTSSPFILNATIRHHLQHFPSLSDSFLSGSLICLPMTRWLSNWK